MNNRIYWGLWFCLLSAMAHSHDGHAPEPLAVNINQTQRLPDGSVFLPKPSQRQLTVRTVIAAKKDLPQTQELSGRVVMDPNAGGKVQASQPGRLEAGPKGWPTLGQVVKQGDLLGYVRPTAGALERGSQSAQAAELAAARDQAERRVARLRQITDSIPQKDLQAAESELRSLTARLRAVAGSLDAREELRAPVSGTVAAAQVLSGQIVEAREVLFEIVDPGRLRVEALVYDARLAQDVAGAALALADGRSLPLEFLGAGRVLREQALPLQFRLKSPETALAIGQPVRVLLQQRTTLSGLALPASAIVKNAANQDSVWVHEQAERFVPHPVRVAAVDGATVVVLDGLTAGARVVVQGAALLNQIR